MNIIDIIEKKKTKQILTKEEIGFFIDGCVKKTIPDYQISALLMAIW
ncbi:Pyrimidine-nucleoside phosphorylase, partial [Mycoplasmoides gallisepticum]